MMLLALVACVAVCMAQGPDQAWEDYKLEFGKVYTSAEEEAVRYETWKIAVAEIELHNVQYEEKGYKQGLNQFTDMTDEEFKADYGGCFKIPEGMESDATPYVAPNDGPVPNDVDWRQQGYVTAVKNQGRCGSCYSFSATGALEGQWFKKTGQLISLSESQIVDCSGRYGNYGCRGGWYQSAWRYIRDAGGSETERAYPYRAVQQRCRFNRGNVAAKVTGYHDTRAGSESELTSALAHIGPVSVAIDASHSSFRRYRTGVYYEPYCSSRNLDHAVLAVGYGSEGGRDYYLVKNSWATTFGSGGYIKMARNRNNNCGIATKPSYPTV